MDCGSTPKICFPHKPSKTEDIPTRFNPYMRQRNTSQLSIRADVPRQRISRNSQTSKSPQSIITPPLYWQRECPQEEDRMMDYFDSGELDFSSSPSPPWPRSLEEHAQTYPPISQLRSSAIQCSFPSEDEQGLHWYSSPMDIYPPFKSSSFYEHIPSNQFYSYPSPSYDTQFISSAFMYPFPAQPKNESLSPPSSPSSSSSSSCFSSPVSNSQPPLKLHQPRPSRRIPIISISELASAYEEPQHPHQPESDIPEPNSSKVSSFSFDHYPCTTASSSPIWSDIPSNHNHLLTPMVKRNYDTTAMINNRNIPANTIICSCGCMESYTI